MKTKSSKTFQEAIHCIKGAIINCADFGSFSSHLNPFSTPQHIQHTVGTWANKVPIKCTDLGLGPRTGVVHRGGSLGKMSQRK